MLKRLPAKKMPVEMEMAERRVTVVAAGWRGPGMAETRLAFHRLHGKWAIVRRVPSWTAEAPRTRTSYIRFTDKLGWFSSPSLFH